jgi:hypothetical protein
MRVSGGPGVPFGYDWQPAAGSRRTPLSAHPPALLVDLDRPEP